MSMLLDTLLGQQWAMHLPVLLELKDIVLRHGRGERLSEEGIEELVAARGDRDGQGSVQVIDGVGIVPITGVLFKGAANVRRISGPAGTSTGAIQERINTALQDPAVRAIVLNIDSPGGSVSGIDETAAFIRNARKQKPMVTFASDLMASAATWLGSQADRVITNTTGEVGSIGVYMVVTDSSEMYAKTGINVDVIRSGIHKGAGTWGAEITEEQRAEFQRVVDELHTIFVKRVASGRNMNVKDVREIATGSVFVGPDAIAKGLVDKVGTLADAVREAGRLASQTSKRNVEAKRQNVETSTRRHVEIQGAAGDISVAHIGELSGGDCEHGGLAVAASVELSNGVVSMDMDDESKKAGPDAGDGVVKTATSGASVEAGGALGGGVVELKVERTEPVQSKAPAVDTAAIDDATQAGAQAERARSAEIRAMATTLELGDEWADAQVASAVSVDDARKAAFEAIAKKRQAVEISVGEDLNASSIAPAMVDAICLRAGTKVKKPHGRAAEFRGLRLFGMAREFLNSHGVNTKGRSDDAVCREVFRLRGMGTPFAAGGVFGHSTSDFPLILADASGKRLRQGYEQAPSTWDTPGLMRRRVVPDFKDIKAFQLGEAADLTEVKEGAEYQKATISEAREVYRVSTYGKLFSHTRQMLINDDMDAFSRIPELHGAAAKRLEEVKAWYPLTSTALGENMSDAVAIFNLASHANYLAAGYAPTVASLGLAQKSFRMQTGLSGEVRLNLAPSFLVVPAALEVVAKVLVGSSVDPAGGNSSVPNPFRGSYVVVVNPALDAIADGTTAWYMFCNTSMIDTIEVAFLEGNEQPFLDQEEGFNIDGITYKVRHEIGAKCIDWRGLYKTKGVGGS